MDRRDSVQNAGGLGMMKVVAAWQDAWEAYMEVLQEFTVTVKHATVHFTGIKSPAPHMMCT